MKLSFFPMVTRHLYFFPMNCLPFILFIKSAICHIYLQDPFMININSFPGGSDSKDSACNVGNQSLIPRLGRSPGEANGNPPQYYCLENPMDGGAWQATIHRVAKSWTSLSNFTKNQYQRHLYCATVSQYPSSTGTHIL